ncbi:MAG: S8 family serine peptidase [Chloroflexota bacterium]
MHKLYRVAGMILLFLVLANGVSASGLRVGEGVQMVQAAPAAWLAADVMTGSSAGSGVKGIGVGLLGDGGGELPLDPEVRRVLASADAERGVRVIVHMDEPGGAGGEGFAPAADGQERARLVSRLQGAAGRAQRSVRAYLERERVRGNVSSYRPLWITNAIAVEGRPSVVRGLARQPSVAVITLDHWRRWIESGEAAVGAEDAAGEQVEWNIERIRADEVWASLQISGTGAVVAGMDTGVDWLHPALERNYGGYNPHGPSNHAYSWYDATDGDAGYPVDGHGHGSHTMGTMVGRGGIGVAPGARWIGVRVLNNQGYGYDSWIHAGFEWVLAPGGDPSRAPDVVNCSWGSSRAYLTTFQDDLRALRAGGILPVFSNGNNGPGVGTVTSPASLPEAFAVGAVDEHDGVATFSSRGPSPWGEVRPHVAAPGVHVRSSVPGGAYATMNGTSMAAPHVSGVAALLRSVSSTLSITRATAVITGTALPLGEEVPNNDTGWGRVDAFAAVTALARPGFIAGTVKDGASDLPIAGASVRAMSRGGETSAETETDVDGGYLLALSPGVYDLSVSAFGYEPASIRGVRVLRDAVTSEDVTLVAQPTGSLNVQVVDASSGEPVTATLAVLDTPYEVTTHTCSFELPSETYAVRARRLRYRVVTATAVVSVGETSSVVLRLPEAPAVLVVDSGGWYYESQMRYYRQALDDGAYAYHEWSIRRIPEDIPAVSDLGDYDIVVWSAPRDAPGYIGAGEVITGFLEAGGRLLLTGQDVGFWDGGGSGVSWSPYYRDYLKAQFVDDDAPTRVLDGVAGDIFGGTTITIAGAGGADNQDYPDVVSVADPEAAGPVMVYRDDGCGGVRVGTCVDYRVLYFAFGFEAINDRVRRRQVMESAIEWLEASPPTAGLRLAPTSQLGIGVPGSLITHTVRVSHVGQGGRDDEIDLTVAAASWPTELSAPSVTLSPCTSASVTVTVKVPVTATWDSRDVVTLTAQSSLSTSLSVSARLESKAPAPILLVDDDRWYDQQATYTGATDDAGLAYDLWENSPPEGGGHGAGPSVETLRMYPVVVWWTGYDWYAPVTTDEMRWLGAYVDGGGRLFLSSQDFLTYHGVDAFSREHLGVLTHTEDVTPTGVTGVPENLVGDGLGPWSLEFPTGYRNWSDSLVPTAGTGVALRDQDLRGVALTRQQGGGSTVFFAFPFEASPGSVQAEVMERVVGWLSWLGGTTFEADRGSVAAGDVVSYTITVRNDGPETVTASVSNTLPAELALEDGSVVGAGSYDPTDRRLWWRGLVDPGGVAVLGYRASVVGGTAPGEVVVNTARVSLEEHTIGFSRRAEVRVDRPDLSASSFGCAPGVVRPGGEVTCTLRVINAGVADADAASALVWPPDGRMPASESVSVSGRGAWEAREDGIYWTGPLPAGGEAVLTFSLLLPGEPVRRTVYGIAFLDDGGGGRWERPTWLEVWPWRVFLPVAMQRSR